MPSLSLRGKAEKIKLLILDVDGVLTNGNFWYADNGEEQKCFHTQDGLGMKRLQKANIQIAIISGRQSPAVDRRMKELDIAQVFQGQENKQAAYESLLNTLQISPEKVAYVGDDLPDMHIMKQIGFRIAVNNAVPEVKEFADWCTTRNGGEGAVREACELILSYQKVSTQNETKNILA
jgi:3-deoxy-D-manno-octulosonate 8-phosphate phosphatase (KDO 8-P phosphatase)